MELLKTQFLTSTTHRLPTPVISLSISENLLVVISNWGDASKTDSILKIINESIETSKKTESKKSIIEKLSDGILQANNFLLTSSNINTWSTVVEVLTVYLSGKTISWVNASSICLYKKRESSSALDSLNHEHKNKMLKISSINQEAALPFFGIGLQSSLELDSGESSVDESSSELLILNSMRTPLLSTEPSTAEPSAVLDLIATEFPNSAAWASSLSLKS